MSLSQTRPATTASPAANSRIRGHKPTRGVRCTLTYTRAAVAHSPNWVWPRVPGAVR
jgi:hypothetical protein